MSDNYFGPDFSGKNDGEKPKKPLYDPYTGEYIGEKKEPEPKPKYDIYTGEYIGDKESPTSDSSAADGQAENAFEANGEENPKGKDPYGFNGAFRSGNGYAEEKPENPYGNVGENNFGGGNVNVNVNVNGGDRPGRTFGIISLVLGILSLLCGCCGGGLVFSIVAIVLAAIQLKSGAEGCAIAGLVTGIIGLVLSVVVILVALLNPQAYVEYYETYGAIISIFLA
ncbi:MAG: DUF4190 domain-containing protein [Clostridia bacterium]|nr:DUF4190 domain-containing protein [Clostridia bacterium]